MFRLIDKKEAIDWLLPRHYSGRKPPVSYAFADVINNEIKAVCTFGKPPSDNLCYGVCGHEFSKYVIELNRLCREDDYDKQLSQFVGFCLRELKNIGNFIVISFSDTSMHHNGYIYQATNFIYTGESARRTDWYDYSNKHPRSMKNPKNGIRRIRSTKNRYIYFVGDRRFKKQCLKALNYEILPYPKVENENYELGHFQSIEIVDNGEYKLIEVENKYKKDNQMKLF